MTHRLNPSMNIVKAFGDGQKIDRNSELSMRSKACLTRANTHLTCLYDHFVSATLQSHSNDIPMCCAAKPPCYIYPGAKSNHCGSFHILKMYVEIEED